MFLWIYYDSQDEEIISLNSIYQVIFIVKCFVFSEVRTKFLNAVWASSDFKGLMLTCYEYKTFFKSKRMEADLHYKQY